MRYLRSVASLGVGERKVLTFWKKSKEVKRVILESGAHLIIFVLVLAVISIALTHFFNKHIAARLFNVSIKEVSPQFILFGLIAEAAAIFILAMFFPLQISRFSKGEYRPNCGDGY